jgi:hypothetical protein
MKLDLEMRDTPIPACSSWNKKEIRWKGKQTCSSTELQKEVWAFDYQTFAHATLLYWVACCCTILRRLWTQSSSNKSLTFELRTRKWLFHPIKWDLNFLLSFIMWFLYTCRLTWQYSWCYSLRTDFPEQDLCIALLLHLNWSLEHAQHQWIQRPAQNLFRLHCWILERSASEMTDSCINLYICFRKKDLC